MGVSPHDVERIATVYFVVLITTFLAWNIVLGQTFGVEEYLWPLPVAVIWTIVRWWPRKLPAIRETESIVGSAGMLTLIHRTDDAYKRKVEGLHAILPAAVALSPLWPILALILAFIFLVSGAKLPFPTNLIFSTSLLALAISLLSMSWNFIETQSIRIQEALEKRIFDLLKQHYGVHDHGLVRAVIRRRLKSGHVTLETVFQMNPKLFTRKALAESLFE